MIHYSVVCLGATTAALSSGAVVTSITGIGVLVGAPVAAIAALSGAASTGLSVINKKLERKVNKHSKIHALAVAKHDSINSSVSQALDDNKVSDNEFKLIVREMQKYCNSRNLYTHTSHKNQAIHASQILKRSKMRFGKNLEKNLRHPAQIWTKIWAKNTKLSLSLIKNRLTRYCRMRLRDWTAWLDCVTFRDGSWKRAKPWSGGARWLFLPSPGGCPFPFNLWDRGWVLRGDLWAPTCYQ